MNSKYNSCEQILIDDVFTMSGGINISGNYSAYNGSSRLEELLREALYSCSAQVVYPYGLPELRENISLKISSLYGQKYSPENEITITSGSNQAFYAAIAALVGDGDEVILFEPANESYLPAILLNGAKPVYIPLKEPDFHVDWEEVIHMINGNTRVIIINTPHNPSGMVFTELDMLRLQKIITGTRIVVLSDECFEHITYDGYSHQSVSLYPKLVEKSVLINSFSYTCNVPGWNVGFCAAPESIMQGIRKVLNVMGNCVFAPFQVALASYITNKAEYSELGKLYQEKRDFFSGLMDSHTRFVAVPSYGTFYQLYSFKNICDDRDKDVAKRLMNEFGVGTVPLSLYYHEKSKKQLLRFNFAQPNDVLTQIVERLQSF